MGFIDEWRAQTAGSIVEAARLAPRLPNVDLKFELMVVGVLWPARQRIQDFEVDALGAVQEIVGGRAVTVLRQVQQWTDDMLAAARSLAALAPRSSELDSDLKKLIAYFNAFPVFARQLAQNAAAPPPEVVAPVAVQAPPRVLLAYVQRDGVELAAEIRQTLAAEGVSVWPDLGQPAGQRNWWAQMTAAIAEAEYLVVVMTPAAAQSKLIRRQWRAASQHGTCIFPVTRADDIDYSLLPRWIRQVHFFNLKLEWPKLIAALKQKCETPRVPFMADDLPDDFVDRPQLSKRLLSYLFDPVREESIPGTVGLYGAGGYGKTTLAQMVCHNDDIRQVFDNGILWVTLGETPGDLSRHVVDLIEVLSGERPGFSGLDAAVVRLSELLADRELLLVIDDVWDSAHLKPFLQGGSHCARLITTRNISMLPVDTKITEIGPMQPAEGVSLLRYQLPAGGESDLQALAQRMGGWPLLLKLTNGTLRERTQKYKQPLLEAVAFVNQALDQRGLTAFDDQSEDGRDLAVNQAITISLDQLTPVERERFNELAIFPDDIDIPQATLETLWGATAGLDDFDTEELADHLHALSLLSKFDLTSRQIRLHKVMHSYLRYQQREQLVRIHQQFLEAHVAAVGRWSNLPASDGYMWTHLAYHLLNANRAAELLHTVKELPYLAAKIQIKGSHYAESDLKTAQALSPTDAALGALRRAVSQASYLLVKTQNPADIINTLHSRMVNIPDLAGIVDSANLPRPLITARHMLPDLPDPRLIRTLWGHTTGVLDCAISADGSTTVSVDKDNTVIIWDTNTGAARFRVMPSDSKVWSCAANADGSVVVYGAADGRVTLLDTAAEAVKKLWNAHEAGVISCCISADGKLVVTASKDKTLKIWDAATGTQRAVLEGHERTATRCGISADGRVVVSASNDGTVKLWDAATGAEHRTFVVGAVDTGVDQLTFYSQRDISFGCAISADGRVVAGASSAGILNVWDAASGELKFGTMVDKRGVYGLALSSDGGRVVTASSTGALSVRDTAGTLLMRLEDHTRIVNACDISANGLRIVSASDDKTVKVWDGGSSAAASLADVPYKLAAQTCAVSADGRLAVTALADNSVKVWDVAGGADLVTLRGHTRRVNSCAISADGTLVVTASQDQTAIVWDAATGQPQHTLAGHSWSVNGCAIGANGLLLMTASDDSTIKVWETRSGEERFTLSGHSRAVKSCAINSNGAMAVSASGDGTLRLWNPHTGEQRAVLTGHTALVNTCAISADGSTVVSASLDKTLKVWNTRPAAERLTLAGHDASVTGCAISADGRVVVSVARDKTLKVWDGRSGACLGTLFVDEPLHDCACSADAGDIVAVSSGGVYFLKLVQ